MFLRFCGFFFSCCRPSFSYLRRVLCGRTRVWFPPASSPSLAHLRFWAVSARRGQPSAACRLCCSDRVWASCPCLAPVPLLSRGHGPSVGNPGSRNGASAPFGNFPRVSCAPDAGLSSSRVLLPRVGETAELGGTCERSLWALHHPVSTTCNQHRTRRWNITHPRRPHRHPPGPSGPVRSRWPGTHGPEPPNPPEAGAGCAPLLPDSFLWCVVPAAGGPWAALEKAHPGVGASEMAPTQPPHCPPCVLGNGTKGLELGPTRRREGSQCRLGPGDSKCALSVCCLHRSPWSELALPTPSGHSPVTMEREAILPSWLLRCPTGRE